MNKTRERIKNVLICVLLLSMVYLTYLVWFFDSPFGKLTFAGLFGNEEENYMIYEGTRSDTENFGIRPIGVFVRDDAGGRGAIYESGAADSLYRALRDELAGVVMNMEESVVVTADEWRDALLSKGVFLDYFGNLPTESLCLWLGRRSGDEKICARYFMFSVEDKNVLMYTKNSKSGEVRKFVSSYPSDKLLEKISSLTAVKNASLAIEEKEPEFGILDDETLIMENRAKLSQVSVSNAFKTFRTETTNACLAAFKLRDGNSGTYAEQDGTVVYVADMVILKISPEGIVTYTDSRDFADETLGIEVEYEGEAPTLAEKTETARSLASAIISALPGRGGLYIEDVTENRDKVEVTFGRTVNGVPVKMKDTSYFMRVRVENKMVKSAKLNLRYYEATSNTTDIFSEKIAAAAMGGKNQKGSLRLLYRDSGESVLSPAWYTGQVSGKGGNETDGMVES
ncbi:MAG: hypothetical protein E7473_06010 [Ruminococcaceae bacterium]|nr:hypothetical protein [Oscillospiraceae bacterium]